MRLTRLSALLLGATIVTALPLQAQDTPARRRPAPRRTPAPARVAQPPAIVARAFPAMLAPDRAVIGITLGEPSARGLRVEDVAEDGPAAKAGLEAGDYLTAVGDVSLRLDESDLEDPVLRTAAERRLRRALEDLEAGDAVTLRVAGDGGERTVRLTTVRADALEPDVAPALARTAVWGVDEDRAALGLSVTTTGTVRDTLGAFVMSVVPGGPAERAGVYEGARIMAVNDVDLRLAPADTGDRVIAAATANRLERALDKLEAGDEVTLRVYDDGRVREVRVRTAKASDVYQDGMNMLRVGPAGTFVVPAPDARGLLRVRPGDDARMRIEALPRGRVLLRSAPDVDVELRALDELDPEVQERVRQRMEGARERMEEAQARIKKAQPRTWMLRPGSRWYDMR